ncbi:MAG: ATP-binding cassette domain-containing protein [Bifidobacteriaceae bacterium]|nr:ATP-binding cassette domain-containing protein [Bifidobacteriaceae bacterium]
MANEQVPNDQALNGGAPNDRPARGQPAKERAPGPILAVEDLTKHFRSGERGRPIRALDGVTFSVARGETFGLVGESGSGKSTCARTIVRLYEPTAGRVWLDGTDITKLNQRQLRPLRRKMQMVFQDPYASLNGRMSVRDLVAEPLTVHCPELSRAQVTQRVRELLEQVGLGQEHMLRYAHEFSGGQRQRIGIARALAIRPELVLCDEPISALDVSIQAQIANLLSDLQREMGLAYVFIAHDLSMVRHIADRVGVMYLGQLVEKGPTARVYGEPLHPYTQGLLASIPTPDPTVDLTARPPAIEGEIPSPINPPSGCRFRTRCPFASEVCAQVMPQSVDLGGGHEVACHLYDEGRPRDAASPETATKLPE